MKRRKIILKNVTLIAVTSVNIYETVRALLYSMKGVDFNEVVLVCHKKPFYLPASITHKYIDPLKSIDDFSYAMIYDLHRYVDTEYALIVHYDGFVVHPECWREEFLDYDFIGSPWRLPTEEEKDRYRDVYGNICRVGNGVSLRSRRLMKFPSDSGMAWERQESGLYNEDSFICCKNRHLFEDAGMKIAPIDVAKYFGHEKMVPETEGIKPFLFHQYMGKNQYYPRFRNILRVVLRKLSSVLTKV